MKDSTKRKLRGARRSRTVKLNALLGALPGVAYGAAELVAKNSDEIKALLQSLSSVVTPGTLVLILFAFGMINIVLRSITSTALEDRGEP